MDVWLIAELLLEIQRFLPIQSPDGCFSALPHGSIAFRIVQIPGESVAFPAARARTAVIRFLLALLITDLPYSDALSLSIVSGVSLSLSL